MKLDEFITKLHDAGWQPIGDAQHEWAAHLWKSIFPEQARISELEGELELLEGRIVDLKIDLRQALTKVNT